MDDDYATCYSVGINGNCGLDCPVLLRGDCEEEESMIGPETELPQEQTTPDNFDYAMEMFK